MYEAQLLFDHLYFAKRTAHDVIYAQMCLFLEHLDVDFHHQHHKISTEHGDPGPSTGLWVTIAEPGTSLHVLNDKLLFVSILCVTFL